MPVNDDDVVVAKSLVSKAKKIDAERPWVKYVATFILGVIAGGWAF